MTVWQLRSREKDLSEIFTHDITLRHIASELESWDINRDAAEARAHMDERGFDEIGVMEDGVCVGFARAKTLGAGTLGQWRRPFCKDDTMPADTPLAAAIRPVHDRKRAFVTDESAVWGIVTLADLQKLPVRLYLFGLITLIEMQLLRLIRCIPESEWRVSLKKHRIDMAQTIYEERSNPGTQTETDLAECLEFCDKYTVLRHYAWFQPGPAMSKRQTEHMFGSLRKTRDDLAHAEPIEMSQVVFDPPDLLAKLETITPTVSA